MRNILYETCMIMNYKFCFYYKAIEKNTILIFKKSAISSLKEL